MTAGPHQATVALVSVSYGSEAELTAMLASVPAAASDRPLVVVADNLPSTGRTREVVTGVGGTYLPMRSNLGYGGAINEVVKELPPAIEWVMITNPDVVFHEGAIDHLVEAGGIDDRIGAVGPVVRNDDGSVYPSAREVPGIRVGSGHALFSNIWSSNPWTRRYHAATASDAERDAGWLSGSCVLVRRRAFDEIGGFDEGFFMYFEDVDLGYRLTRAGWRNRFTPTAEVTHSGGHSTAGESAAMIRAHHRSAERFIRKKYSRPLFWPVRIVLLTGLRLRSTLAERRAAR
ncbi:glycosyltransferase family 2 protein [Agromyces mariniharenae]|uniref:Glycosyltransferase family 2 protein n=1 Tax=Agromyces mariniharenae TaxID=2604423 RepID=A0A5S4V0T4_9MICO|nr:glycosyltransferase family 2 protein [Agromyces mariniharenae]TYL52522.1 glycosyltransferase family 2 protein [Agromyces mariniharenae]